MNGFLPSILAGPSNSSTSSEVIPSSIFFAFAPLISPLLWCRRYQWVSIPPVPARAKSKTQNQTQCRFRSLRMPRFYCKAIRLPGLMQNRQGSTGSLNQDAKRFSACLLILQFHQDTHADVDVAIRRRDAEAVGG